MGLTRSNKDVSALVPEATEERGELVEVMVVDTNGVADVALAPQNNAGGWQSVQEDAAAAPAEAPSAAARFAPGTKFVVSTS